MARDDKAAVSQAVVPAGERRDIQLQQALGAPALSGTANPLFARWLALQVAGCQPRIPGMDADEAQLQGAAALAALAELKPADALEGLLATQMVATHSVGLELMRLAMASGADARTIEGQARMAARFLGLFARQAELLARQRGRRRRKISIEHERVDEDGRLSVRAEAEQVQG